MNDEFKTLQKFDAGNGREGFLHSLPELETQGVGKISRLPISIRIVLESVLRNCDGKKVRGKDVETLARWDAKKPANEEIPFVVARIVLQDFTGVPLVVDLAAMRSAVKRLGGDPKIIEPLVPVDLVVDHSVQVDFFGSAQALPSDSTAEGDRIHAPRPVLRAFTATVRFRAASSETRCEAKELQREVRSNLVSSAW